MHMHKHDVASNSKCCRITENKNNGGNEKNNSNTPSNFKKKSISHFAANIKTDKAPNKTDKSVAMQIFLLHFFYTRQ